MKYQRSVTIISNLSTKQKYIKLCPANSFYATGIFSSRKIEQATYEALPFILIAGGMHPDHDTIANFCKTFFPEIEAQLHQEIEYLIDLGKQADNGIPLPSVLSVNEEIIRRQEHYD